MRTCALITYTHHRVRIRMPIANFFPVSSGLVSEVASDLRKERLIDSCWRETRREPAGTTTQSATWPSCEARPSREAGRSPDDSLAPGAGRSTAGGIQGARVAGGHHPCQTVVSVPMGAASYISSTGFSERRVEGLRRVMAQAGAAVDHVGQEARQERWGRESFGGNSAEGAGVSVARRPRPGPGPGRCDPVWSPEPTSGRAVVRRFRSLRTGFGRVGAVQSFGGFQARISRWVILAPSARRPVSTIQAVTAEVTSPPCWVTRFCHSRASKPAAPVPCPRVELP